MGCHCLSQITVRVLMTDPKKNDEGKLRYDLLPVEALEEIVKALTYGATKYGDNNWANGGGHRWSRIFGSMMRHIWAWWGGEDMDKDSGLHHLALAGSEVCFLLAYIRRGTGVDNRPHQTDEHYKRREELEDEG